MAKSLYGSTSPFETTRSRIGEQQHSTGSTDILLIGTRSLGANIGATRTNDFPGQADGYGRAADDHAGSRTNPNDGKRRAGI